MDRITMRIFVYGTLKRGHRLHHHLAGQCFVGQARTRPEYRLVNCGWYPALIESSPGRSIDGEVWEVSGETLECLDEVEGVSNGLYIRRVIALQAPFDDAPVMTYFYLQSIDGLSDCGDEWTISSAELDQSDDT